MSIVTDSTPLEEPKDPSTCNVVQLYRLVASPAQVAEMEAHYRAGNYGYGHAKTALLNVLLEVFAEERARFETYMANPQAVYDALEVGATKARLVAQATIARTRAALGF